MLTDQDLKKIGEEMGKVIEQNITPSMDALHAEIGGIHAEIGGIRAQMVTKDYLDEKLGDLRGDLTVLMRKEDVKLRELISILHTKQVLTPAEVKHLFSLEPFPALSL